MEEPIVKDPKSQDTFKEIDRLTKLSENSRKSVEKELVSVKDTNLKKILHNDKNISILWEHSLDTYKMMIFMAECIDTLQSNTKESILAILKILDVLGKDSKEVKEEIKNLKEKMKKMKRIKIQLAENLTFGINPVKFAGVDTGDWILKPTIDCIKSQKKDSWKDMSEATWVIVIGLIFDIAGALLIVNPIRHSMQLLKTTLTKYKNIVDDLNKPKNERYEITPLSNKEEIDRLTQDNYDRHLYELKNYKKLMIGVGFLVFGFILQIFGNWFLNPPI